MPLQFRSSPGQLLACLARIFEGCAVAQVPERQFGALYSSELKARA